MPHDRGPGVIQGWFAGGRPRLPGPAGSGVLPRPSPALASHVAAALGLPLPPGCSALQRREAAPAIPPGPGAARAALPLPPGLLDLGRGGAGQPLPAIVQREMEGVFRFDFSSVRVRVGPQAAAIGAIAFTHGTDLYFAPGQWNPHQAHGRRLLAHELAHVVQQRTGRVQNPFGHGTAIVQDPGLEAEAERMALRALQGEPNRRAVVVSRAARPGGSLLQPSSFDPNLVGKETGKKIFKIGDKKFPSMYTGHLYGAEGSDYCAACYGGLHDYDVRSTTTTYSWALTWLGQMEQDKATHNDSFMLGVLYAGGRFYAANSGERYWPMDYLPKGIGYIHDAPESIRTRGGFLLPPEDIEYCQVTNRPLNCAGAKLVSYAVSKGMFLPFYMTEIWYDPKKSHGSYKHGAIIESCPTCKHLLMALLCPLSQEEAEQSRSEASAMEF